MNGFNRAVFTPSNLKATASAIGTVVFAILTVLAGLSYDLGPLALIIKPEWKPTILWVSGVATVILWLYSEVQKALVRQDVTKQLHRRH